MENQQPQSLENELKEMQRRIAKNAEVIEQNNQKILLLLKERGLV